MDGDISHEIKIRLLLGRKTMTKLGSIIKSRDIGAPQYVRQMLTNMKGEINNNTIIVGDFNTPTHIWIDQLNRKLTGKHKL